MGYAQGTIQRYKARLVAKGYAQEFRVSYEDMFSPMARMEVIRLLFIVGAQLKYHLYHFNVESAFLNGEIVKDVYVEQPKGFVIQEDSKCTYLL